jgi:hypothetical protein
MEHRPKHYSFWVVNANGAKEPKEIASACLAREASAALRLRSNALASAEPRRRMAGGGHPWPPAIPVASSPSHRQFSSQVPPSNSNAHGAPGAYPRAYPWDNLAHRLWILAEMETIVDSVLFRSGMRG